MYQLGEFTLHILSDGLMRSDVDVLLNGASNRESGQHAPSNSPRRILLAINCLLIQSRDKNILVDAGIGEVFEKRFQDRFQITRKISFFEQLRQLHIQPEAIHAVILTHLHYDHIGHCTRLNADNELVVAFPNAYFYVQEEEWRVATGPDATFTTGYLPEALLPLERYQRLVVLNGDTEILPGIRAIKTGGHTTGHQIVLISSQGHVACFPGDLAPTSSHLQTNASMKHDVHPNHSMTAREHLIQRAIEEKWLLLFSHSPNLVAGFLNKQENKILIHKIMI
ncbi:MAG: MBL fold metallo-hydrolase [Candidatus Zhuqueibacterota bacterium]